MTNTTTNSATNVAIDVGNTHVHVGIRSQDSESWNQVLRFGSTLPRTSDEWNLVLTPYLKEAGVSRSTGEIGVASVVPSISAGLSDYFQRYMDVVPILISPATCADIIVATEQPSETGQDRIANAVAAFREAQGAAVVVDMGTATKVDAVDQSGRFLGGAIAPGMGLSLDVLAGRAARLYQVPLVAPDVAIGTNTVAAVQSGLILGHAGMVRELVRLVSEEIGGDPPVFLTGGYANIILVELPSTYRHCPTLTLDGIAYVVDSVR